MKYLVIWGVEVDAPTPVLAAQVARLQQLDPDSRALLFVAKDGAGNRTKVDLSVPSGNAQDSPSPHRTD